MQQIKGSGQDDETGRTDEQSYAGTLPSCLLLRYSHEINSNQTSQNIAKQTYRSVETRSKTPPRGKWFAEFV